MKIIKASNLTIKKILKNQIKILGQNADFNHIDLSSVTILCDLFNIHSNFNGDISNWDVSNVTDMSWMFLNSKFNGDISKWDTSNVKNMSCIFYRSEFNGDISKWNTSNVQNMSYMFYESEFNGDISKWNISELTHVECMFYASKFSGDLSKWDISKIKNMEYIFDRIQNPETIEIAINQKIILPPIFISKSTLKKNNIK